MRFSCICVKFENYIGTTEYENDFNEVNVHFVTNLKTEAVKGLQNTSI